MSKQSNVYVPPAAAPSPVQPAAVPTSPALKLLGVSLLSQNGATVPTTSLLGPNKYIGFYFSAHWCPPCRMFTPQLAKWYSDFKASSHPLRDAFEVVFVTSDRDEASFLDYFKTMPWKALPYAARDAKVKLSAKLKVTGIPAFIILDAETGEVVTRDGRSGITSDPAGTDFPWHPKSLLELLQGTSLVNRTGVKVDATVALGGKTTLVYFSAHWCPPCRRFTPALVATYEKLKAAGKDVEVVFVSADRDPGQFTEYLAEMPWLAVPYEAEGLREALGEAYEVEGYPTVVVVGPDGKVVNQDGCKAVMKDPEGADFPWRPAPPAVLAELTEDTVDQVNEGPVLVLALEERVEGGFGAPGGFRERAEGMLRGLAQEVKGGEDPEALSFLYGAKTGDMMGKVLAFAGTAGLAGDVVMVLDVPGQKKYIAGEDVRKETVERFARKFMAGGMEGVILS